MRAGNGTCSILFLGMVFSPLLLPTAGRCWHLIFTPSSVKPRRTDPPPAMCIVLKPTENPCEHQDPTALIWPSQGLSRKPGAAHPQLGLRATMPNMETKGGRRPGTSLPSPRDIKQTPRDHSPFVSPAGHPRFDLQPSVADGKIPGESFGSGPCHFLLARELPAKLPGCRLLRCEPQKALPVLLKPL